MDNTAFTEAEYRERVCELQKRMADARIDAYVFFEPENIEYFTGHASWSRLSRMKVCIAVVPAQGKPSLVVHNMEQGDARAMSVGCEIAEWRDGESPIQICADVLKRLGSRIRIGYEEGEGTQLVLCVRRWNELNSLVNQAEFVDASVLFWKVRLVKSPAEVARMKHAAAATEASIAAAWAAIRPGMTERDLQRVIVTAMVTAGADLPHLLTIHTGVADYVRGDKLATDRRIEPGDWMALDLAAIYRSYICDMCRMGCLGRPSDVQRKAFDWAREINLGCQEAIRPGMTLRDLQNVRRKLVADLPTEAVSIVGTLRGYAGMGHSIGMSIHEQPRLWTTDPDWIDLVLEPGMVFCTEPNLRLNSAPYQWFAIEDMVLVTADGYERLTASPSELAVL